MTYGPQTLRETAVAGSARRPFGRVGGDARRHELVAACPPGPEASRSARPRSPSPCPSLPPGLRSEGNAGTPPPPLLPSGGGCGRRLGSGSGVRAWLPRCWGCESEHRGRRRGPRVAAKVTELWAATQQPRVAPFGPWAGKSLQSLPNSWFPASPGPARAGRGGLARHSENSSRWSPGSRSREEGQSPGWRGF